MDNKNSGATHESSIPFQNKVEMMNATQSPSTPLSFSSFCVLLLLIALSLLLVIKHQSTLGNKKKKKPSSVLPPGPKPWPFVGCLPAMLMNKPAIFRWIHRLMGEMNTDILCIRLGNVPVIAVTSPELAREFLKKQDAVFSSRPLSMAADITSRGYMSLVHVPLGDQWKKMRRIVTSEVLSPARHHWLQDKREEEADHLVRYIYNQCTTAVEGGSLVNVRTSARHYCTNVIRRMLFGKRCFGDGLKDGRPGAEEEEHVAAIFTILGYIYSFCVSDYLPFLRGYDLDGHEKIMEEAIGSLRKYHDPEIEERIRQWSDGKKSVQEDFLDVLITLKDIDGRSMLSTEEIKAQTVELVLATADNPSNAIEWALAEMINQPEMLQRATEELDRVVGRDRLVQESDLSQLNYVKACAREAFRLHPVAPFNLPHVSVSDTTVEGFLIPKGSHVLLSRLALGRNPRVWEEPLRFIPERHLKDDGSDVVLTEPDLKFVSFSTGRRGCPAVTMGSTITAMLFARLLQGFTWSTPPNVMNIELTESVGELSMAKPLLALAKPRLPEYVYPIAT